MVFLAYWDELNRKLPGDGLIQKKRCLGSMTLAKG